MARNIAAHVREGNIVGLRGVPVLTDAVSQPPI